MIKKQQQFIPKGMNQDIAETKIQSELAHNIKNLRVVTDEKDGILSLVTEKGTIEKQITRVLEENLPISLKSATISFSTENSATNQYYLVGSIPGASTSLNLYYSFLSKRAQVTLYFEDGVPNPSRSFFLQYLIGTSILLPEVNLGITNKDDTNTDNARLELVVSPASSSTLHIYYNVYDYEGILQGTIDFVNNSSNYNSVSRNTTNNTLTFNIPILFFSYKINNNVGEIESSNSEMTALIKNYVYGLEYTYYKQYSIKSVIGSCVVKDDVVFFGKAIDNNDELDIIFKIKNLNSSNSPTTKAIYLGNLNFDESHPIKTYLSYENENTQKIYWIDGLNQPRVINIANDKRYEIFDDDIDNHFNFCTPVYCEETINIVKKAIGGFFHSGVIQYFITYVDQNDQESKIFYASPLYYLTDNDRALSPEENSTNSFVINLKNINANKLLRKKLRIYSLHRTSLDATPVAKLVYELKLTGETSDLSLVDTGNIGFNVDPQILLLLGCDEFVPQTMSVKDNTMFFGNLQIKNYQHISDSIAKSFEKIVAIAEGNKTQEYIKAAYVSNFQLNGINPNASFGNKNGSDSEIKGFMYNEEYMLGLQFLHKTGEWTEPIWCCDYIMTKAPKVQGSYQTIPYFYRYYGYNYFSTLINQGYIAVRPLVVFNDQQNCRVLCQGLLGHTIEYDGNYYPSWFFRPLNTGSTPGINRTESTKNFINAATSGTVRGEVQGFDSKFTVKTNLLTFNSPEVEFEKITTISKNYDFCFIGCAQIHAVNYDIEMLTSTSTYEDKHQYGLLIKRGMMWTDTHKTFAGGFCWADKTFQKDEPGSWGSASDDSVYYIWPWENDQSYSCAPKGTDNVVYSAPERKIISNYRFSQYFSKLSNDDVLAISEIHLANNNYIKTNIVTDDKEAAYIKDVDILCTGTVDTNYSDGRGNRHVLDTTGLLYNSNEVNAPGCNTVRIQYKTTPHIILSITNYSEHWISYNLNGQIQIGELLNNAYNETTKFKGRLNGRPTETSMYENVWYVAGDTIKLPTNPNDEICIKWTKGDTYYQRYDCLKTYPYSHEAKNSIVDVLSCMIQTRINLDGRYDKNRCSDILHIDPTNFNKLNDVYSQQDNFFTYHKLDPDKFQNVFPSLITWSKQKVFGETSDSWTNIHLVNVLDLDGSLGEITALKLWNNKLIAFQNKGISVVKYNENIMLPSINGASVEVMNSGLVTGKEYLTNQFGCQNEWSIVNAKSGLYFSDDYNHKLYVLSDGIKCISDNLGFKSYLKTKNYSDIWKPNRILTTETTNRTLHTFYDQQLGEIYFTDGEDCLTFNENLNLFTSFYNYNDIINYSVVTTQGSFNPKSLGYYEKNDGIYILSNDTSKNNSKTYYSKTVDKRLFNFINLNNKNYWALNDYLNNILLIYEHRVNDYLNIFDVNCNYEIELTSNIDSHIDKIFDTVEIRGDAYISNSLQSGYNIDDNVTDYNKNITSLPFDTIQVNNEYQDTGTKELQFTKDIKTAASKNSMKQKFRIWRAQIGRDTTNARDRIRNYWSRIKLTKNGIANLKAKIHDIIVDVYE